MPLAAPPQPIPIHERAVTITPPHTPPLRIFYLETRPPPSTPEKAIVVLLHGFPQTSHQFRHVLPLLAAHGQRCIAPDFRGIGRSTTPLGAHDESFRKSTLAQDVLALLAALSIPAEQRVHVVGHDIGGMVAFALAARWPERCVSVCWGECPLPGSGAYWADLREHAVQQFHFVFHRIGPLAEALVAGRERMYVEHFLQKITYNHLAFSEQDVQAYAVAYAQPGAMRSGMGLYRAFEADAQENVDWRDRGGKCAVPTLVLSGAMSRQGVGAEEMAREFTREDALRVQTVPEAAHYLAEENPEGFVKAIVGFWEELEEAI